MLGNIRERSGVSGRMSEYADEQRLLEQENLAMLHRVDAQLGSSGTPDADALLAAVDEVLPHTFDLADRLADDDEFHDTLERVLAPFMYAAHDVDLTHSIDRDGTEHRSIPHRDDLLHLEDPAWRAAVAKDLRAVAQRGRTLLEAKSR
jgi:hypothetical protein